MVNYAEMSQLKHVDLSGKSSYAALFKADSGRHGTRIRQPSIKTQAVTKAKASATPAARSVFSFER